jgi:hypothetical protein
MKMVYAFLHSFRGRRSIAKFSASVNMTALGLGAAEEEDSRCGCVHERSSSICSLSAKSALNKRRIGWTIDDAMNKEFQFLFSVGGATYM